jgi:hypothetical protein
MTSLDFPLAKLLKRPTLGFLSEFAAICGESLTSSSADIVASESLRGRIGESEPVSTTSGDRGATIWS